MSPARLGMEEWLHVAFDATKKTATGALAAGSVEVQAGGAPVPNPEGAYVPLLSGRERLHVALLTNREGCYALTRRLLGMSPDEEPSYDDVVDAVGEIVNIVAGIMQQELAGRAEPIELGLPLFVNGHIVPSDKHEVSSTVCDVDSVRVNVVVLRGASSGSARV